MGDRGSNSRPGIKTQDYKKNKGSVRTDLSELALGHTVPVEDDPGGFVSGGLVELDEELTYH